MGSVIWPLYTLGIGMLLFAAWSIDFAHLAYIELSRGGDGRVGLPILPGRDIRVTAGFWWNLNFFLVMLPGAFLIALSVFL